VALNSGRPIEAVNASLAGATGNTQIALWPTKPGRPLSRASAIAIDRQLRLGAGEFEIAIGDGRTRQLTSFVNRRSPFGDQASLAVDFKHSRVVVVMRAADGAYATLVASRCGASLVAREDIAEFGLLEETQRYISTVYKRPLLIHALINFPDRTSAFLGEMMPYGREGSVIVSTSEFKNAEELSVGLKTVPLEEWHRLSDIHAVNRRWLNEAVRAVDAVSSPLSHTAERPVAIGGLHIAFEHNGMLQFWWGDEEPDELVILDRPRIEQPADPHPMLSIPAIDHNPLVGGPPWWPFPPVTTRCCRIRRELDLHRAARTRFTEVMRVVSVFLPLIDQP
jgi:hypothetical protein